MSSDRQSRRRDGGARRTRGNSVDGSDSDRETRGRESESPPRTRRPARGRRNRRGANKSLRKLADMYKDVPTNSPDNRDEHERETRGYEYSEDEVDDRQERDVERDEPVSEQSYESDSESQGDSYQQKIDILNKIEILRKKRQTLKDQKREWQREFCDDERHPLENYRERDYMDALPEDTKQAWEEYEDVKDKIEDYEAALEKLDVKKRRVTDQEETIAEGNQDLIENAREEWLRVKQKRDEVLDKTQEQIQEKHEASGEMKMIEHESDEIQEAIRECQDDVDLINEYDVDLETKSVTSLKEMTSRLDRDIDTLQVQTKTAVDNERDCDDLRVRELEKSNAVCEELETLRSKEEKVIRKSRDILKQFKKAFNPRRFADVAREEPRRRRSIITYFSRSQAPMSNDKIDHCRRSSQKIEDVMKSIPDELQRRRRIENDSDTDEEDDCKSELKSLIIHLLTKIGGCMMDFNELLLYKNDMGDERMYTLMHRMEESLELENEIEMLKANTDSTEYSRTLSRLKALKKINQQLRDERKFRNESFKKFKESENKYRKKYRDQTNQIKKIKEYEKDNKNLRDDVKIFEDIIEKITSACSMRKGHLENARDLVWSCVRSVGDERRGRVRGRRVASEGRQYRDYDSDDEDSFREHALQEIAMWDEEDLQQRSRRTEPSRYPRGSSHKDRDSRGYRGRDSYTTPGGYNDSPKASPRSPKSRRSSPQRRTAGYDEYDNKCEDPPCEDTPGAYRDGSRRSRSMRSASPERSPRAYTRGGSASPSPPSER